MLIERYLEMRACQTIPQTASPTTWLMSLPDSLVLLSQQARKVVLGIITVTRATRRTTGAAIGLSLNYDWSPKDINVAVCTTYSLLPHMMIRATTLRSS